ncbi:TIGR02611 family protein [Actinopolymorpha alba]|uniref:TIGR02611 family protein n=1 Tax=Actinopolymorpha alba TaxID=533267 RepID=UPI00037B05F8|nr:TIGR02611 family protein [Actinopolymorpha alba]
MSDEDIRGSGGRQTEAGEAAESVRGAVVDDPATEHKPPAPARESRWHHRVRGRVRRNRTLDATWRVGTFIVGAAFVVAGLIMFITPGPGWVTVIVGLAILATEFAWARRTLDWAKQKAQQASAKALDPRVRKRNILIALTVVIVLALAGWWWVASFGWPEPLVRTINWVRSWR